MPESSERASPTHLPNLTISKPSEGVGSASGKPLSSISRAGSGVKRDSKELGRRSSSDWTDVDDSPPRTRRSGKRRSRRNNRSSESLTGSQVGLKGERRPSHFLPGLSKILEGSESVADSTHSSRGSHRRRHRDRDAGRRAHYRSVARSVHGSSLKTRQDVAPKKSVKFLNANPSLLSVLSSFTTGSDKSSHSNSTVTQQSYDREAGYSPSMASSTFRRRSSQHDTPKVVKTSAKSPNVFDFMEASAVDDTQDGQPIASSPSSAHSVPSDAGSSQAPDTPSSRSTFPSPTSTRSQTVRDLRKRFDSHPVNSTRSHSSSPDPSFRTLHKRPSVSAVPEEDEDNAISPGADYGPQRYLSSRSSIASRRRSVQVHQQEDSVRQYIAYSQQPHFVDPIYGQRRSFSNSSVQSDRSNPGYHLAMQQYQWPPQHPAAPPTPPHAVNGQGSPGALSAPEPPDLSRRTLTGYEELALELSTTESLVKPLYRKFEYLNHRILLHLQDELCELEEQLRAMDEMIAQLDPGSPDGQKSPASRRYDAYRGSDLHHRRTQLLGNVFMKTEQYNRAMASYTSISKDAVVAEDDQVASYQEWMNKRTPIKEIETRFLFHHQDLIIPGKKVAALDRPTKHAALAYLPVALMLPLLLYSIIPSLAGRLAVTALIAIAAFVVAATTRIRLLMQAREWAVCGGAYVLLMAAIAGCIPSHA